jgi:hypothetical protein
MAERRSRCRCGAPWVRSPALSLSTLAGIELGGLGRQALHTCEEERDVGAHTYGHGSWLDASSGIRGALMNEGGGRGESHRSTQT